ncbi:MAG: WS/DGAT domain-containing protein [Polyangiales bacterium]
MTSERMSPADTAWCATASMLPGPREPLCIDAKRLRDMMFWAPHPARLGVGLSISSYAGKVIVEVRVDQAVSKSPGRLVELFEKEASGMFEKASHSY